MTFLVTDNCIRCKYTDCVEVCPVDCFCEGENMLVINPDECIDCGVCEPECPADAIIADAHEDAPRWLEINSRYAALWPVLSERKEPLADAEQWNGVPDKLHFLSEAAAEPA